MNGALTGFRLGRENKLMRLHGLRSCEAVLAELQAYLRDVCDAQLRAYAHRLQVVGSGKGLEPTDLERQHMQTCCAGMAHGPETWRTWTDVFTALPGMMAWRSGLPFMPSASLTVCADVHWAFLIDVDAAELHVFDNRNARYVWGELGQAEPALCVLPLDLLRQLSAPDMHALQVLLQQHVVCDGHNPQLPLRDGQSPDFAGPAGWTARLRVQSGQVQLLLGQHGLHVRLNRVGELRLDEPAGGAFLTDALEPQVGAMLGAIYGPSATLTQVARVAQYMEQLPFSAQDTGLPLLDLGLRPACGLGLQLGPFFFDDLRRLLVKRGMSVQGWRFLIRQEQAVLRLLLKFFPPSERIVTGFAQFINLLATALQNQPVRLHRCQVALTSLERILDRTRGRPEPVREENARVFLRAIMRADLSAEEERNLDHEAQDISDFVYAYAAVLKGVSWRSLRRRSEAWHRALLITVDPATDVRWQALLPEHRVGELVAVELDCGHLLAEEGLEQRHCIGTYVNACSSGASRVFSLRRSGKRLATLELQRGHDGHWRLVQIRGKANSPVTDERVLQLAQDVTQAYNEQALAQARTHALKHAVAMQPGSYVHPSYVVHRQDHWTG
jgi:hypothetical protein